eukprot:TRINITY_DN24804_c2_g1_i1.p1 TRINITY_DN24804_c2_g1~~TRINITY_DN24804_c2_g1_i1.p1  ORF type:complete len:302 (+),score=86.88 TRINITY_DN24804_c2_g1_i1:52-957(+)
MGRLLNESDINITSCDVPYAVAAYGCRASESDEISSQVVIGYTVATHVEDAKGTPSLWTVCKRYSDFRALHTRLVAIAKGESFDASQCRFPGRSVLWTTNASKRLVEQRRKALADYMKQVRNLSKRCYEVFEELTMFLAPVCQKDGIPLSLRCSETLPGAPSPYIHSTFMAPKGAKMKRLVVKVPWGILDHRTNEICIKSTRSGAAACARRCMYLAINDHVKRQRDRLPNNREVWQLSQGLMQLTQQVDLPVRRRSSNEEAMLSPTVSQHNFFKCANSDSSTNDCTSDGTLSISISLSSTA